MSKNKKLIIYLTICVVISVGSLVVVPLVEKYLICNPRIYVTPEQEQGKYLTDIDCSVFLNESTILPIFFFTAALSIIYFVLLFSSVSSYHAWKKFAIIYIPIAAMLILLSSSTSGGIDPIDREIVTWWTAGLFLVISLGIIIYKKLKPGDK